MKKNKNILPEKRFLKPLFYSSLLIIFVILPGSCRKLVTEDFPDFQELPVINSISIADSTLKVHVSLTDKISSEELGVVEDAEVVISEDNIIKDTLSYIGEGIYSSVSMLQAGHNYSCKVSLDGHGPVYGNTTIPVAPEIINIEHINIAGLDEEGIGYPAIKITIKNNPEEIQYFQAIIWLNKYGTSSQAEIHTITDPVLLNEGLPLAIFSNETIESETYTMLINYTTNSYSSTEQGNFTNTYPLVIEFRRISYDYYMYIKNLYLYEKGRYPSDITTGSISTFNLYSNIENGYGIFASYANCFSDTIVP